MRSYNYVIVPMIDFDHVVYRIRAIDFDQQSFEGKLRIYRPQFFKENLTMVNMVRDKLLRDSVDQYKVEERSIIAKRILSSGDRLRKLVDIARKDTISLPENVERLKKEIYDLTHDLHFKKCQRMGEILDLALDFVRRNYEDVSMKQIITKKIGI
jgi:hypothetical protein